MIQRNIPAIKSCSYEIANQMSNYNHATKGRNIDFLIIALSVCDSKCYVDGGEKASEPRNAVSIKFW